MEGTFRIQTDVPDKPGKRRGISGSTVKMIAVISMLIDHAAAVVLARQIMEKGYLFAAAGGENSLAVWIEANKTLFSFYQIMRMVGRLGFPIFCFLLVEGFQKTRDVRKYALRLGIFALISEIPFNLAIVGKVWHPGYQNVFFTLFLGLFVLWAYGFAAKCCEPERKEKIPRILWRILIVTGAAFTGIYFGVWLGIWFIPGSGGTVQDYLTLRRDFPWEFALLCGILCLAAAVFYVLYGKKKGMDRLKILGADMTVLVLIMYLAELLHTDYAGMGVLTITVMYLFRRNRIAEMAAGCVILTILSASELCAFFALIPIALYNGERGLRMKYFFYAFYPVHLFLLYLIAVWLGLGNTVPM